MTKKEMQRKIDYEIVVDCYNEDEVSSAWYIYLEDNIAFPFEAVVQREKTDGSTVQKKVKVVGLGNEEQEVTGSDFDVEIEDGDYRCEIAFSNLSKIKAPAKTLEVLAIWRYWIGKG